MKDYLLAAGFYVVINFVVFHGGLYRYFCEPESYSGNVYARMEVLKETERQSGAKVVALIGDSVVEEGIDASQLSSLIGKPVVNLALPGTTPLEWSYFLRSIDPDQDRFDAILFTVVPQRVRTMPNEEGTQSLLPISSISLMIDYLTSQDNNAQDYYVAFDRIYAFRRDIRDLILNPDRWHSIRTKRMAHLTKIQNYPGQEFDVCSVKVKPNPGKVVAWGEIKDEEIRRLIRHNVNRISKLNQNPVASGIHEPLKSLTELYADGGTRIVVVSIPFGPGHRVSVDAAPVSEHVEHWTALDVGLFRECSNFYDYRHLNQKGRQLFSEWLSQRWLGLAGTAAIQSH